MYVGVREDDGLIPALGHSCKGKIKLDMVEGNGAVLFHTPGLSTFWLVVMELSCPLHGFLDVSMSSAPLIHYTCTLLAYLVSFFP